MLIIHFVGSDPYGGHRRYASIVNDVLLEMGLVSEVYDNFNNLIDRAGSLGPSSYLFFHSFNELSSRNLESLRSSTNARLVAFLHNPQPNRLLNFFDIAIPVSKYVEKNTKVDSLKTKILAPAYVPINRTEFSHFSESDIGYPIITKNCEYVWDKNKVRDRILEKLTFFGLYPCDKFCLDNEFENVRKIPAVHIAVVSRLARLKQFPELIRIIFSRGQNSEYKKFHIHFVGAGPWRVVTELKASIPEDIRRNVSFWGWQPEAFRLMRRFDAILLGLPDKEALGLNILEATFQKVPVIGIGGGPFDEVVESGQNGWLISKERAEKDFEVVLENLELIAAGRISPLNFKMSHQFTERFSEERFRKTLMGILE